MTTMRRVRLILKTLACIIWLSVCAFQSCGVSGLGLSSNYQKAVQSGFKSVPESLEIENLYGEADHFLTLRSGRKYVWNTSTIVEGRYEFDMQCDVRLNAGRDAIEAVEGDPVFYVYEIGSVQILPDGRAEVAYTPNQITIGPEKWKAVKEAAGDLSVAGLKFERNRPVQNVDEHRRQVTRDRVKVRPSPRSQ